MACCGIFDIDPMSGPLHKIETRLAALERSAWYTLAIEWQTLFWPTVVGASTVMGVRAANRFSKDGAERPNYIVDSIVGAAMGAIGGSMFALIFTESPAVARLTIVSMIAGGLLAHYRC